MTFGHIDDTLDHFVNYLIGGVGQHQLAKAGNKRRHHQQRDIEDVRKHFFQVIPPGPAGHAVGILGGNREFLCIVENLVELLLVVVAPKIFLVSGLPVGLDVRQAEFQVGVGYGCLTPTGQI
ncbi:hypothetical protein D3C81_902390 [compost metagenome]